MKYRVLAYFPNHLKNHGIGRAAFSIVNAMNSSELECLLYLPSVNKGVKGKVLKVTIPSIISRVLYKIVSPIKVRVISELIFFMHIRKGDIIYLWPGFSMSLFHKIKEKGNIVVVENINCHQKVSKRILDEEANNLNVSDTHTITELSIDTEIETLKLCDYVFSPSPSVTRSLLDSHVLIDKILESSYGLNESQQIDLTEKIDDKSKTLEFIFVGRVGVRKGVHLLLEYWCDANVNGILKVIGNIDESIQELIEPYRHIDSIQFIDFVTDISSVYASADVFIFPSLEEGSPLVTYLALGAGLPCLVSPMGGLGVVTHEKEGFIIDAHDKVAWVKLLRKLANSPDIRKSQSLAAREASDQFLWTKVGKQRTDLLLQKLIRG